LNALGRKEESLRERYRNYLQYVEEEQKTKMREWVNQYGNQGSCVFATLEGSGRRITSPKKLVILRLADAEKEEYTQKEKTKPGDNRRTFEPRKGDWLLNPEYVPRYQPFISEGSTLSEEPIPSDDVEEKKDSNLSSDEVGSISRRTKKRKGYEQMHNVDKSMMPSKAMKLNSSMIKTEHSLVKVEDGSLSPTMRVEREQMLELLYSCSNNLDLVNKALINPTLRWTQEQDDQLTGPNKRKYITSLAKLKGPENVKERVHFLKNISNLKLKIQQKNTTE